MSPGFASCLIGVNASLARRSQANNQPNYQQILVLERQKGTSNGYLGGDRSRSQAGLAEHELQSVSPRWDLVLPLTLTIDVVAVVVVGGVHLIEMDIDCVFS